MIKLENIRWSDFFTVTLIPAHPFQKGDEKKYNCPISSVQIGIKPRYLITVIRLSKKKVSFEDYDNNVYQNVPLTTIVDALWDEFVGDGPLIMFSKEHFNNKLYSAIKYYVKYKNEFLQNVYGS